MGTLQGTGRANAADLIGKTLGNWLITGVIGDGSFGVVYEAHNVSIAGRRAAVKVLHPHMSMHHEIKQRFLNEASAASRAEHENIVQVFDGGIGPDGVCYSVMELLKGRTLGAHIADGPMEVQRALAIAMQVAGALEAAHQLGIVHRDLKPDNVFITQRSTSPDFVKVLDFGVCKLRGALGEMPSTQVGQLVGTPGYMSPEQWMTLPDIDGRADIYALGVILFECFTGDLPFEASNPYAWQQAHLTYPVPDLSSEGVPPEMVALIERFMAKRREDRPQTMLEAMHEMQAVRAALFPAAVGNSDVAAMGSATPAYVPAQPSSGRVRGNAPGAIPSRPRLEVVRDTLSSADGELARSSQIDQLPRRSSWVIAGGALAALALGGGIYWATSRSPSVAAASTAALPATHAQPSPSPLPDELVALGPADFEVGWSRSPNHSDGPPHAAHVAAFALGKYEVSMGDYQKYVDAVHLAGEKPWDGVDDFASIRDLPVNAVTQAEAARYCAWKYPSLGGRLPTENEWELAARDGHNERRYPWGGDHFDPARANGAPRGQHAALVPVDALPGGASERGLLNLIGNVAEWTSTVAAPYPGSTAVAPAGTAVVRGGAANSMSSDELNATARRFAKPDVRDPFIGFRCATSTR